MADEIKSEETKINYEKLQKECINGFDKINCKDQEVVLMIGNTGAGKSTTINYLIGHKLKHVKNRFGRVNVDIEDENVKSHAKIGHGQLSETIYPECYSINDNSITLCDYPGFEDNRCIERQICISIFIELAVKMSKKINGIIIVISYAELESSRGSDFRRICYTLNKLLPNPEGLELSTIFLFTKVPSDIEVEHLYNIICDTLNTMQNYRNDHPSPNAEAFIKILTLMSKDQRNIFIVRPLDNGQSKEQIISFIRTLAPISKDRFDFSNISDARTKFNTIVFETCRNFHQLIREKLRLKQLIISNKKTLENNLQQIQIYQTQLTMLKDNKSYDEYSLKLLNMISERTEYLQKEIDDLQKEIFTLKKERQECKKKLEILNDSNLVTYWRDSVFEKRSWCGWFCTTEKNFTFSDRNAPYDDETMWAGNGSFQNTQRKKHCGYFSTFYKSEKGKNGNASVEILIKKKNLPDYKIEIQNVEASEMDIVGNIKLNEEKIKINKGVIDKLFLSMMEKEKARRSQNLEQTKELENKIKKLEQENKGFPTDLSIQEEIKKTDDDIVNKMNQYKFVKDVTTTLVFTSPLVDSFLIEYNSYIEGKETIVTQVDNI